MSSIEDVLASLPDRPLSMDEAESVAKAFKAEGVNRVTYDDETGERRVWMLNLLVSGTYLMLTESHERAGWEAEVMATDLRDSEFYETLDATMRQVFDVGIEPSETIWFDDEGNEIERYPAQSSDGERR